MKSIQVTYFAMLREQRGCSEEPVETAAATVGGLYEELQKRHGFTLTAPALRAAVNQTFCDWDAPIESGDAVVFLPPVAGG